MSIQTNGWKDAFLAFLDRRALIMLFLGFSAGIPILLIFSSLSLWLGEAGINKSAVTFFSWAALGYSFKFVWAPLVDELPVPILTKLLGRRRAWLIIAQLMIVLAICIMAFSNPALGQDAIIQMAVGAVLLGFSAATQDIVIDAYRIELAETQMQTILASTYNAGYRIGMIVAGAGALFLAAKLGTAKGNYIYEAWKYTYLCMALVMLVGIITTLVIREPKVNRIYKTYKKTDYYRLVFVFFITVISFVCVYIYSGTLTTQLTDFFQIQSSGLLFLIEALRFIIAVAGAVIAGRILIHFGAVNKQMAKETWVNPILDFFRRYGTKLALVLLLLIGFYRISDIIAGVISNVFYQDLNFSKEEIAEAVKIYGVVFSLVGGFLGGLLAQRMNIMKLMFIGAMLASSTNLIFIGLVKSGYPLSDVRVMVSGHSYMAKPDDVGYFHVDIPNKALAESNDLVVSTKFDSENYQQSRRVVVPYLINNEQQIRLLPLTGDDQLFSNELQQNLVVKGQISQLDLHQLRANNPIVLMLDGQQINAKLEANGLFSAVINVGDLKHSTSRTIKVNAYAPNNTVLVSDERKYTVLSTTEYVTKLDIDVDPIAPIDVNSEQSTTTISGKVIKSYSSAWLYFAIVIDNMASGLAGAAFIAFLSSLTSVSFTAVQYAIFSSLMTLTPKILGGYSGTIVNHVGYPTFFLITTLIGIPVLFLVYWVSKLLAQHQTKT